MHLLQIQGLFAPFVACIAAGGLLLLWNFNRQIRYLPIFALSLIFFAAAFLVSQLLFEKMSVENAISSSIMYFIVSGLMIHGALLRLGEKLNLKLHVALLIADCIGRVFIIESGFSSSVYLIYGNALMGSPMAIAAFRLLTHEDRDLQSVSMAIAYGTIAGMAIIAPSLVLQVGAEVTKDNYFSSMYWTLLSFLTVFGISLAILAFGFTVGSDILRTVREQATTDLLSGLPTRRKFDEAFKDLIASQTSTSPKSTLILCDIDHFKSINDRFGHLVGDNVIATFGSIIRDSVPAGAIVGRLGGEEFGIVLTGCGTRGAHLFADGLRLVLSNCKIDGITEVERVTASFGVVEIYPGQDPSEVYQKADRALYSAKQTGRNLVKSTYQTGVHVVSTRERSSA